MFNSEVEMGASKGSPRESPSRLWKTKTRAELAEAVLDHPLSILPPEVQTGRSIPFRPIRRSSLQVVAG